MPGTPWYREGLRSNGTSIGPIGESVFTASLFSICQDTLTCKTVSTTPCMPPSSECIRDMVIGNCEHFGANAHALDGSDESSTCFCYGCVSVCTACYSPGCGPNCCMACYTTKYRTQLRSRYHVAPTCCCIEVPEPCAPFGDFCTHCWCHSCAHCQETNELFVRGLRVLPAAATDGAARVPNDAEAGEGEPDGDRHEPQTNPLLKDE